MPLRSEVSCPRCGGGLPFDVEESAVCRCGSQWAPALLSPSEVNDLPMAMLMPAARLVEAVHAEDSKVTHELLGRLSVMELRALAVDLAALVPVGDVAVEALALIASPSLREEN